MSSEKRRTSRSRTAARHNRGQPSVRAVACAALLAAWLPACTAPQPATPGPSTATEAATPAVSAEARPLVTFADPYQRDWFRLAGAGQAGFAADALFLQRSRGGERSLAVRFAPDDDSTLVLDFADTPLPTDWSNYGRLVLRLQGPPETTALALTVYAEPAGAPGAAIPLTLRPGWDEYTIDLDAIADTVDLARVRRVTWQCLAEAPRTVGLDAMVLASPVRVYVARTAEQAGLEVFERGPRLHVHLPGGQQLGFRDGVLQSWIHPELGRIASDAGFGPWPVLLRPGWSAGPHGIVDPFLDEDLPTTADGAESRPIDVREASPLRVVLASARRIRSTACGDDNPPETWPAHTWRYVVYADGRIYCQLASSPGPLRWRCPEIGYLSVLDSLTNFALLPAAAVTPDARAVECIALERGQDLPWALTWTSVPNAAVTTARLVPRDAVRELAVLGGALPAADATIASHLFVLRRDLPDDGKARIAAEFADPPLPDVTLGALRSDVAGDLNGNGFNERDGCYELAPHRGRARLKFDPLRPAILAPVFRVHDSAGRDCLVYCNGAAVPCAHRDAAGNALFLLPPGVPAAQHVEVFLEPREVPAD